MSSDENTRDSRILGYKGTFASVAAKKDSCRCHDIERLLKRPSDVILAVQKRRKGKKK